MLKANGSLMDFICKHKNFECKSQRTLKQIAYNNTRIGINEKIHLNM